MKSAIYLNFLSANSAVARSAPEGFTPRAAKAPAIYSQAGDAEDHLYLYDVIVGSKMEAEWFGGVCAEDFAQELSALSSPVIRLHVDSPGGSVFAARAMATAIRSHASNIIVQIDGMAASAATLITSAGDEVLMGDPGSMMMIHRAWSWASGNAEDFLNAAALLEKIDGTIIDTYHARTGLAKDELTAMVNAETWMTAQEAVDKHFADSIMEAKVKAHTAWDVSAFLNPPKLADNQGRQNSATPSQEDLDNESKDTALRARQLQRLRVAGLLFTNPQ